MLKEIRFKDPLHNLFFCFPHPIKSTSYKREFVGNWGYAEVPLLLSEVSKMGVSFFNVIPLTKKRVLLKYTLAIVTTSTPLQ